MAVPAHTVRVIPTGFKMPDGFKTTIAFASNPNIQFWEVTVKPSGGDAGEPIPTTTMHNIRQRTFDAKQLITHNEISGKAMLDPDVIPALDNILGIKGSITEWFPDGSSEDFFGFLQKYEFDEFKEGEPPMLSYTIAITNWDPVNFVEQGPVFHTASGT